MYRSFFKRAIDLIVSLTIFLLLFPVFLGVAILLLIFNGGSPFFFQPRPGKNEKIFTVIKFKTMSDKKGPDGNLLPDKDRLTLVGKVVRKTSLDEIPQLLNVIKGDMSLIGPRPLLVEYLELYNVKQKRRHEVRPGITGLAQVNGRNALSWEKRFDFDVEYVDNFDLRMDILILIQTVEKVFKAEGISAPNSATMEKFKGSKLS